MIKIINVYIEGHNYEHDLFELIRAVLTETDIKFIDSDDVNKYSNDGQCLLISKLSYYNEKEISAAILHKDGQIVQEYKEEISEIPIPLYSNKECEKLSIKKGVYNCLTEFFNKKLPWGILTGIRPVKIVHKLMDMDISHTEVLNILQNQYKFHSSKAELILEVASSQRKHIYPRQKNKFSLYINIPFCPSKCSYCSFPSFKIDKNKNMVEEYIDSLILELTSCKELFKDKELNTVYIGGGTPTSLETIQLQKILKKIKEFFPQDIKEFTVEAGRPDTIDREKLVMIRSYGVNRISINPQTFNLKTLKTIGRNHNIEDIKLSYNLAKSLDFDIINMDIILGLPGEEIMELKNTLKEIKSLGPDNLTVHTLSVKRGSNIYNQNSVDLDKQYNIEKMLEETINYSKQEGYFPYYMYRQKQILGNLENIGYARPNKECIYNISMMEEKETILGFGLGAVTKIYYQDQDKILRIPNFKSLQDYINRISEIIEDKKSINFDLY